MPPLPKNTGQFLQRQQTQTRNMNNINESDTQEIEPPLEGADEIETTDPEPTRYITELMEDWNKVNLIEGDFKNFRNREMNITTPNGEEIIQTKLQYKSIINLLAARDLH